MTEVVKVEGEATLRATLGVAARRIETMDTAARKTATFLGSRGRTDAPRLTGRLASSVRGESTGGDAEVVSGLPYSNRTHWGFARYGQRPQPWLVEGRNQTEQTWLRNYEDEIEDALAGVKGAL